jgi:hypothetical protein
MDVSVITLSNVLYTPGALVSKMSWPVMERQGFTRTTGHGQQGLDGGEESIIRHATIPTLDLLYCHQHHRFGVISISVPAVEKVDMALWAWGVEIGVIGRSCLFRARRGEYGDDNEAEIGNGGDMGKVGWVVRYGAGPRGEGMDVERMFRGIMLGGVDAAKRFGIGPGRAMDGNENGGKEMMKPLGGLGVVRPISEMRVAAAAADPRPRLEEVRLRDGRRTVRVVEA